MIEKLKSETLSHRDRLRIGRELAELGDPRPGVGLRPDGLPDIVWIPIPGGRITLEEVDHVFKVKPFRMAKYLVTNSQFEAFLTADGGYKNKEWWNGIARIGAAHTPSWPEANAPRESVSWFEAVAFCRWLSQKTRSTIRLPFEWEWQQAATGGDPRCEYPWAGWDEVRCNSDKSLLRRTTAVGMYPRGATKQGVMDMAGNLWEWCLNRDGNPAAPESRDINNTGGRRVLRGGSWKGRPVDLRVSNRSWNNADFQFGGIGFRLVQDIP